jgi:hypothetical protein
VYLLLKMKGSALPDSFMAAHPATSMALSTCVRASGHPERDTWCLDMCGRGCCNHSLFKATQHIYSKVTCVTHFTLEILKYLRVWCGTINVLYLHNRKFHLGTMIKVKNDYLSSN